MSSEKILIERSRRGDAKAFGALVSRYEDRIYRLAKNVCAGLPAEAEDVYQETFITAYKKLGAFRGGSDLGTWLYRIAANLCFMRHRSKKREPFVPLLDLPREHGDGAPHQFRDWGPTPDEAAAKKELLSQVAGALAALPVEYRLAVTLRDIEGLSNREVGRVLGLGLAAVKSRVHRGRLFLRDRFESAFGAKEAAR